MVCCICVHVIACAGMQGNAPPDSWRVMERFVSQANHFLPWGPPVYGEHPLSEELWAPESPTTSSIEPSHSSAASHSGSRYCPVLLVVYLLIRPLWFYFKL